MDQQQALDTGSQSGSKAGPGSVPSSAVSPSPPELASGRPFERSRQYGSFPSMPSLPSNAPPNFGIPIAPNGTLPGPGDFVPGLQTVDGAGVRPSEYGYPQASLDGQRHWEQVNDLSSPGAQMSRARDSMQPQYWRSSPTGPPGPSADFAPFPAPGSHMSNDTSFSYPVPNTQSWQPSQAGRSVSYGQLPDGGPQGYMPSPVGYPPQPSHEGPSTSTATYPPTEAKFAPGSGPGSGQQSAPGGTPMMPFGQPHPFMFQPQEPVSASPISSQHPYANQWYGDSNAYGAPEQGLRPSMDYRPYTSKPPQ